MARHGQEAGVDLALLADANAINSGAHIVVNSSTRHAAQDPEGVMMGIEQHLVALKRVSPDGEGPAMRQFHMRDLELGSLAAEHRPVLTPIELKGFTGLKDQRNKYPTATSLLLTQPLILPSTGKSRHTTIGSIVAQGDQVRIKLSHGPLLLAGTNRPGPQPAR